MSFVHVHNHTEYSLLDGANRIPELVARAKELEMPALAITDHGVMFGVMEFYFECKKQGIKPLIGMEAYVAPNGLHNKSGREENQTYHLVLLARNQEGYRNLCKLHTTAALQGFYYSPRIDHELLRAHAKGLIGTSACLGSEVCRQLMAGDYGRAQYLAGMYKEIFDEDCFFIELQDHRLKPQAEIRDNLLRIARELDLPLVCTNDAHYLCKGDAKAHDVLLCIGTGALVSDEKRLRFETEEFYLKSEAEMREIFHETPEAIENTLRIADMCDLELGKQRAAMPQPELPEGKSSMDFLRDLAQSGLADRIEKVDDNALDRLNFELGVIEKTGFSDYFLLVREFANFTRDQKIAFGVRGSAAGSLVSYCIGITDVDPLEYDLTFERFLNPERISMPDIDMDFEDARRDEVIHWVTERYGHERVSQIITFGTLGARAAIKDAGRVLGYTPQDTDKICKTIPNVPGMTLDKAKEESGEFRQLVATDPRVSSLIEVAKTIEGIARHSGVHAAGIVIANDPLEEYIPLYRGADGQAVTAFEMGILEKIGLLKMDFLGLSNLTVLARTVEHVQRKFKSDDFSIESIPLNDIPTFEMLARGETVGVFQLESAGMRRNIIELKPNSIRELAAMVALYRPGPMGLIPKFVDFKFGRGKPEYLDERMKPILEETYGIIVYQDQVLKLVQALAGFSLGKADILRRAMGKKDRAAMDSMMVEFMMGTHANGISEKAAKEVWELLLPFAGYAFNKAHAVCYAILAYRTAYLKCHFPVEYMAALLEVYRSKEGRVTAFIEECRRQNIAVLPPDVNKSFVNFTIETAGPKSKPKESIRFGLAAIKGVGEGLVQHLLTEREANGEFSHLFEFAERTKGAGMNRGALEALVKAGALDSIDPNRKKLMNVLDAALQFADNVYKDRAAGQDSLFLSDSEPTLASHYPVLPETPALSRSELLAMENEVLGIYVSDHPLRGFDQVIRARSNMSCAAVSEAEDQTKVRLAGVVTQFKPSLTKKGTRIARFLVEDFTGQAPCVAFSNQYAKFQDLLVKDKVVLVTGTISHWERQSGNDKLIEVRVDEVEELIAEPGTEGADEVDPASGTLTIRILRATKPELVAVRDLIESHPGDYNVVIQLIGGELVTPIELLHRVEASPAFLRELRKAVSRCEVHLDQRVLRDGEVSTEESELEEPVIAAIPSLNQEPVEISA